MSNRVAMTTDCRPQSRARPIPPDSIWQSDSGELTIPPQRHIRNTMVAICYATRALRFHATRWLRFVTQHELCDFTQRDGCDLLRTTFTIHHTTGWLHSDQHCVLTTRLSGGSTIVISISFVVTMFDQAACRLARGSMAGLTLCTLPPNAVRKIMHRNCDSSVW